MDWYVNTIMYSFGYLNFYSGAPIACNESKVRCPEIDRFSQKKMMADGANSQDAVRH